MPDQYDLRVELRLRIDADGAVEPLYFGRVISLSVPPVINMELFFQFQLKEEKGPYTVAVKIESLKAWENENRTFSDTEARLTCLDGGLAKNILAAVTADPLWKKVEV